MARTEAELAAGWGRADWRTLGALLVLTAAVLLVHALRGPNFVLDDWFTVEHATFDGVARAAGSSQMLARPGTVVAYGATFGVFGDHPLPIYLVLSALGLVNVGLLYALLRRFLELPLAAASVAVWVVLPNHMSLEIWPSTANIVLGLTLALLGAWLVARPAPSGVAEVGSIGLLVAASLCYEAFIPVAAVLVVVVPWLTQRRVAWRYVGGAALALAATTGWIVTHWHPSKNSSRELADVSQMLPAHFGWGIVPDGPVAAVVLAGALCGVVLVAARVVSRRGIREPEEAMVLGGLAVMVVGTAPFATYFYAPLGAGDRFNFVSSIGGALVVVGLVSLLLARWRPAAVVVGGLLLVGVLVTRWDRSLLWDRAGNDAVAITSLAVEQIPEPAGTVAVGPAPIQEQNIAAFLDHSNIQSALRVKYGDDSVVAVMTFDQAGFETFDPSQRVDIRPVSSLEADVEIQPGGG
jgi:hypothetical protein